MSRPANGILTDEPATSTGERVVMWLFMCGGLYLILAPLLMVLTARQDAVGYWSAGALAVVWLAGATMLTWWVTRTSESEPPAGASGERGGELTRL